MIEDWTPLLSALDNISIPVENIVMLVDQPSAACRDALTKKFPSATIHELADPDARVAARVHYLRDALTTAPEMIIDLSEIAERKLRNLRRLLWALRPGGYYIVQAPSHWLAAEPSENSLEGFLAMASLAVTHHADADANGLAKELELGIDRIDSADGLTVLVKKNSHLFAMRDTELAHDRREILRVEPAYEYASRAELHLHGLIDAASFPASIRVPARYLNRYQDVEYFPRMLAAQGNRVLASSFRHPHNKRLAHPRLVNTSTDLVRHNRSYAPARRLDGDFFQLDSAFPGHFGHVTTEQLGHVAAWRQARRLNPDIRPLMTLPAKRDNLLGFQIHLFEALGIDPHDIEFLSHDEPVNVDSLVTATPRFVNPRYADLDMTPIWAELGNGLARRDAPAPRHERIFISRGAGAKRSATRTAGIERFFRRRGFEIIYPERFPYPVQAMIFAQAKIIAGFAGSGMFNMMFNPTARIILIGSDAYTARNEYLFAAAHGNEIHYFWGESQVRPAKPNHDRSAFVADFDFDLKQHKKALKSLT